MITKKHLKELADIAFEASRKGEEDTAFEIYGFARRHCPNFDKSKWDAHLLMRTKKLIKDNANARKLEAISSQ